MNDQEKKDYLERYKKQKEAGVPFFPDIIFKDGVASLLIFLILIALVYFLGIPTEARANPNDATYTPRPEWYFLFLFQLLKYFPGKLEVVGVMVIPGLFILLLFALPFIDRSPKRHFLNRPRATLAALLVVAGIGALTVLAANEAPPPQVVTPVDQAAALYAKNCANCHGPSITVPAGTDLHELIAQGKHAGMPAWGGDLSVQEIDSLAGFITSPKGSALYTQYCGGCHKTLVQASGNLQELQRVLDEGSKYPAHANQNVPDWKTTLSEAEANALLNFLAAPDGQRLFQVNCSGCHGFGVAFAGTESELRDLIAKGGQHITMPAWQGTLSDAEVETLAAYVSNPTSAPAGSTLFGRHCSTCHTDRVPAAPDLETARKIIKSGGPHVTMPVWGKILTPEQLDALVQYTLVASQGKGTEQGARLFASNCAPCHGQYGQGGPNPARAGDTIVSISSSDFLKTRNDDTIRTIIEQGQPDLGMSPFGPNYGGSLSEDDIDAIVAYLRSWEANPPPELPVQTPTPEPSTAPTGAPTAAAGTPTFSGQVAPLLAAKCGMCHSESVKMGGWDASTYSSVMTSGDNGPVVVAGDVAKSLLATKILGMDDKPMPPSGLLPNDEMLIILDWIRAGAPEN